MAKKIYNNQARVFHKLLKGEDFSEILKAETEKINSSKYYCSEAQAQKYREQDLKGILDVKTFFDKIKFFENPEIYAVNGWGYDQTNYENLKVLGQIGGSMVCILDKNSSNIYTIQKKKYTDRAKWTYLDNDRVRATNWQQPFEDEVISENNLYNAYCGH